MKKEIEQYLSFIAKQPTGTVYGSTNKEVKPLGKQQALGILKEQYKNCTKCPLATQGRTNVVFGYGNPNSPLMFVGEGPGRDEDIEALPFVGRAGKLLTKIIEAMGLKREDVYISNIVKCRPPENRAPLPDESQTCKTNILLEEIKIVQPKIICALGATATQELLGEPISISKVRGTFIPFLTTLVMPTFHPAYLLRNPEKKREVWLDMQTILKELERLK